MKYGITQKKIAHVVKDDGNAGPHAYWDTECGAWIRPVAIVDEVPDGGRMCKHCAKWIDRNCPYGAKRRQAMRPIDADATKKDFGEHFGDVQDAICAQQIIDRQPTIDPEDLRPRGHWIVFNNGTKEDPQQDHMACSRCGWYWSIADHSKVFSHCPNCSAKMGEEVLDA